MVALFDRGREEEEPPSSNEADLSESTSYPMPSRPDEWYQAESRNGGVSTGRIYTIKVLRIIVLREEAKKGTNPSRKALL